MRTLSNVNFSGLRVLLRVDYNVPLDSNGNITDDFKIRKSLPTIKKILKKSKQLIIMSHLGRPEGKKVDRLKMDKVAIRLMKLLGRNVAKIDDCVNVILPEDKIVLLENLRFHKEEKENAKKFAKELASYADFFVNDAFGVCHRAHASVVGVAEQLPSCAGLLVEEEVKNLDFSDPEKPFMVVLGGSKLSTKFPVIKTLIPKVDKLLLGGAMIFTFYKAKGVSIGNSLFEKEQVTTANLLTHNNKLVLPEDVVVASDISEDAESRNVNYLQIPHTWVGLDVGKESVKDFKKHLSKAKTVFWNGPLGYFEIDRFAEATNEIAEFLAELDARVVIGGGDSAAFVQKLGMADKFSHVSTGGGAALELIEKGSLPGLEVLKN